MLRLVNMRDCLYILYKPIQHPSDSSCPLVSSVGTASVLMLWS